MLKYDDANETILSKLNIESLSDRRFLRDIVFSFNLIQE